MTASMHSLPLVLSVDWDYFLPRTIDDFDWPMVCLDPDPCDALLWQGRAFEHPFARADEEKTALELLQIDPAKILSFWSQVVGQHTIPDLRVCDSHEEIVGFTKAWDTFDLINFDAHHDVTYKGNEDSSEVNCGNWAGHLRKYAKLNSYTLVYPRWRHRQPENVDLTLPREVDNLVYGDWPAAPIHPQKVFICRSSPYVPSWCDKEWLQLLASLRDRLILAEKIEPAVLEARPFDAEKARTNQGILGPRRFSSRKYSIYDCFDQGLFSLSDAKDRLSRQEPVENIIGALDGAAELLCIFRERLMDRGVIV